MIWGEDEPYDNWVVSKGWEVWSCASSKFRQYLDIQKESSAKLFLIQGNVGDAVNKKSIPRPSVVKIKSAGRINFR